MRRLFEGLFRGPKTTEPANTNNKAAVQPYPDLPVMNPDANQLGIKAFFLTPDYANYACLNATVDGSVEAAPVRNSFEGIVRLGDLDQLEDGQFLRETRQHKRVLGLGPVIADYGHLEMQPVALIDVVTYPFMFAMLHDLKPDETNRSDWLCRVNHNILCPFIEGLRSIGPALSFFHTHETHLEHAPVHNLLTASPQYLSGSAEQKNQALERLAGKFEIACVVSSRSPTMDDRYCYPRRLPEDGQPLQAETISVL